MEAVVHARGQAQCHVAAIAVGLDQFPVAQQIVQRVRKTLGLVEARAGDGAAGADNGIAWADQDVRRLVDRARAVLELAGEAIVHAAEMRLLGFAQIEIRK